MINVKVRQVRKLRKKEHTYRCERTYTSLIDQSIRGPNGTVTCRCIAHLYCASFARYIRMNHGYIRSCGFRHYLCGSRSPLNYAVSISSVIDRLSFHSGAGTKSRSVSIARIDGDIELRMMITAELQRVRTYEIRPVKYLSNDREANRNLENASIPRSCVPRCTRVR